MMSPQDLQDHVNMWIQVATNDLLSAERLIAIEPMILDTACFHCQQTIEKSFKAFLVYKGQEIGRTHDIDFLMGLCATFDPVFNTIDTLNINDFAVRIRYPGDGFLPDPDEARSYFRMAADILGLVKEKIIFS